MKIWIHWSTLLRLLFSIEEDFSFDEAKQRRGLVMLLRNDRGCILVAEVGSDGSSACAPANW